MDLSTNWPGTHATSPNPVVQQQLGAIPPECGVYRFFGRAGQILYIGKAVNLRRRVRQYFGAARPGWDSRIRSMVSAIHALDWIRTTTELEALLLEDSLIKRYWPDFNTRQKKYLLHAYLSLSSDPYPVFTVKDRSAVDRSETANRGMLFGPLKDLYYARDLLDSVNAALGLRICGGQVDPDRYRKVVDQAVAFLRGSSDELLHNLSKKMEICSERREYHQAARLRDCLSLCRRFWKRQNFYRHFRRDRLEIDEESGRFHLFDRGRYLGSWPTRREREQVSTATVECAEEDSILFDRAMVTLAWLNSRRSEKTYRFLPVPLPD